MSFSFKDIFNKGSGESGKALGKELAEGIGVGIEDGSVNAITAMDNVYVELDSLTKDAAKNAERLAKKQQERKLDNLKNALKLELICEQEYYEKLKVFRDENLRSGSDIWYKCTEEIAEYNKRLTDEIEKQFEKIIELRNNLAEELKSDEPWFKTSKVSFKGMGQNGTDLVYNETKLKDFNEELKQLTLYRDKIKELQALGNVPQGIFEEIGRLSVEDGLKTVNAILSADAKVRNEFLAGYDKRNSLTLSVANDLLGLLKPEELEKEKIQNFVGLGKGGNAANENLDFVAILKECYAEVPESYYALGEQSGESFGEGFLSKIPEITEQVKACFTNMINGLAADLTSGLKESIEGVVNTVNNNYQSTYNFNSSGDTITQQLNAARSAATLERMRGGG